LLQSLLKEVILVDYKQFLSLVEEELEYMEAFDLSYEYRLMKAAGALVILKEYLEARLKEDDTQVYEIIRGEKTE
jgi:hypothetical protein